MQAAIAVMTRIPVPGRTKTRLMQKMSAFECAAFHQVCLVDICKTVSDTGVTGYIYYTGETHTGTPTYSKSMEAGFAPDILNLAEKLGLKVRRQTGRDLGQRLGNAARQVLSTHDRVILLGADLPHLSTGLLLDALQKLDSCDVVIGPARDGGYYLLGIKEVYSCLFVEIPWGSPDVLLRTIEAAGLKNLSLTLLDLKADIDTWDDLVYFYRKAADTETGVRKLAAYRFAERMIMKYVP